jgi:hypothetical protein
MITSHEDHNKAGLETMNDCCRIFVLVTAKLYTNHGMKNRRHAKVFSFYSLDNNAQKDWKKKKH